jgi:hypothetical protein
VNRKEFSAQAGRAVRTAHISLCALVSSAALALAPATALAESSALEMAKEAGLGGASAVVSLVYAPLKLVYAVTGLVVGGAAYAFSGGDAEVARVVLTPSLLGDYLITPKQLIGQEDFEFFGREPGYRSGSTDVATAPEDPDYGW